MKPHANVSLPSSPAPAPTRSTAEGPPLGPAGRKETTTSARVIILVGMIFLAALTRLIPHPPNFAPITAMALFAAAHFRSRLFALAAPLLALLASDLALEGLVRAGAYAGSGWMQYTRGIYPGMWVNYATVGSIALLGFVFIDRHSFVNVAGTTLLASVAFFVVSNFGAWAGGTLGYAKTPAGLLICYLKGIPFFGWSLLSDVFYVTLFFGAFALAERRFPALEPKPAAA
jgi:hypothetical protein